MKHPARPRTGSQLETSTSLPAGNFSRTMKRVAAQRMLGRKIGSIRRSKGLSQTQLARMCRVTVNRIWMIENGRVNLTLSTLLRLSRQLDATIAELTRGIF